jgi:hypothetical protein
MMNVPGGDSEMLKRRGRSTIVSTNESLAVNTPSLTVTVIVAVPV